MQVKTPAKVTGIPEARCAVSPGCTDQGMAQVMQVISALDAYGMPKVVASLRLSADETRTLMAQLAGSLQRAEQMAEDYRAFLKLERDRKLHV